MGFVTAIAVLTGIPVEASGGAHVGVLANGIPSTSDASTVTGTELPASLVVVGAGLLMAIAFTAGYFIIPRGGVDEVFLVHDSGLLLVHFSKTLRPTKDRDVLVGMLTAVQTFVNDSFSKGAATDLREMDFGDRKLLICKGSYGYLAVVVQGRAPLGMARRMRVAVSAVEAKYRAEIASWDGSTEALTGADDLLIASLLTGWLRQLRNEVAAAFRGLLSRLAVRGSASSAPPPASRPAGIQADPRDTARALLRRPELQSFRPEYRDMMAAALQQIEEGHFSLTGLANIYMVMALQKTPRANVVGWWNLVLRTVREVLWIWPWTPSSQAWVATPDSAALSIPPEALPTPLEVPREIPEAVPLGTAMPAVSAAPAHSARVDAADSP